MREMKATTIDERASTVLTSMEDAAAFTQPTIPESLHFVVVGAALVVGGRVVGAAVVVIFTVVGTGAAVVPLMGAAVVTLAPTPTTPKMSALNDHQWKKKKF